MPLRVDGLTAFETMARHADLFEAVRADATKAVQAIIKKHLKGVGLDALRSTQRAFGDDTFSLVADDVDDATLKAVLKKVDQYNKAVQAEDMARRRDRLLALATGRAEPLARVVAPAKAPKGTAPRKPEVERANNSAAMKATPKKRSR